MNSIVTNLLGEQTKDGGRIRLLFKRIDSEIWVYIQSPEPGKVLELKRLKDVVLKPLVQVQNSSDNEDTDIDPCKLG